MLLLNEAEAERLGGEVKIRIEDTQWEFSSIELGMDANSRIFRDQIVDELLWFDFKGELTYQSVLLKHYNELYDRAFQMIEPVQPVVPDQFMECPNFGYEVYSFTPVYTLQKVVLDCVQGIKTLIRGIDLVTEFSLYCRYVQQLNFPRVHHVGISRLSANGQDISKTTGNASLNTLREAGWTPGMIRDLLSESCLIDKQIGWDYHNLVQVPDVVI
jgi:glutamyl/glutaminyl-tRNA synthetase